MSFCYYSRANIKSATAKLFFFNNNNSSIIINGLLIENYFSNIILAKKILGYSLAIIKYIFKRNYSIEAILKGGGEIAQLYSLNKALSKVIISINPQFKINLLEHNTPFSNIKFKERKKFGLQKARKKSQYSKR